MLYHSVIKKLHCRRVNQSSGVNLMGNVGTTTLLVVQNLKVQFTKVATIKHLTQLKTTYIKQKQNDCI